jgi:hypothetical protein
VLILDVLRELITEKLLKVPDLPAIRLFPFIFKVLIAGSSDQSDKLEILEVVATGMPFKRSSDPPAVVRTAPSKIIPTVLILLMNASSASK